MSIAQTGYAAVDPDTGRVLGNVPIAYQEPKVVYQSHVEEVYNRPQEVYAPRQPAVVAGPTTLRFLGVNPTVAAVIGILFIALLIFYGYSKLKEQNTKCDTDKQLAIDDLRRCTAQLPAVTPKVVRF